MAYRQNDREYHGDSQSERRGCFGTKSSKKRRTNINQNTSRNSGEPKYDPIDHHRARALSAFLALFIAFVLALVCVFAGHKPGYLESANLFTVNTSTLGHFPIDEKCRQTSTGLSKRLEVGNPISEGIDAAAAQASHIENKVTSIAAASGSKATGILPDSIQDDLHSFGVKAGDLLKGIRSEFADIKEKLDKATGSAACALRKEANELIEKAVNATGFHQFYSVHVTNWCEGYYRGGYIANATFIPTKNVTKCSNAKRNNTFDLTDVVNKDLGSDLSIADLTKAIGNSWSKEISDHFQQAKGPLNAMVALYCIGIAWVGVGLLGVLVACFKYQTVTAAKWNMCFALFAFLFLGIASGTATGIAVIATNIINNHGSDIGLAAIRGNKFQALTWSATIFTLIAAFIWNDVRRQKLEHAIWIEMGDWLGNREIQEKDNRRDRNMRENTRRRESFESR